MIAVCAVRELSMVREEIRTMCDKYSKVLHGMCFSVHMGKK
jgi:hypothetical protein